MMERLVFCGRARAGCEEQPAAVPEAPECAAAGAVENALRQWWENRRFCRFYMIEVGHQHIPSLSTGSEPGMTATTSGNRLPDDGSAGAPCRIAIFCGAPLSSNFGYGVVAFSLSQP